MGGKLFNWHYWFQKTQTRHIRWNCWMKALQLFDLETIPWNARQESLTQAGWCRGKKWLLQSLRNRWNLPTWKMTLYLAHESLSILWFNWSLNTAKIKITTLQPLRQTCSIAAPEWPKLCAPSMIADCLWFSLSHRKHVDHNSWILTSLDAKDAICQSTFIIVGIHHLFGPSKQVPRNLQ